MNEDALHFTKTSSKKHLKDDKPKEKIKCMFCLQLHAFRRKQWSAYDIKCNTSHGGKRWSDTKKYTQEEKSNSGKNTEKAAHYVEYAYSSTDESCSLKNHQVINIRSGG